MEERKPSKKPLISYWTVAVIIFFLLNIFVFPKFLSMQIKEVDYRTFLTMLDEKQVGQVQGLTLLLH